MTQSRHSPANRPDDVFADGIRFRTAHIHDPPDQKRGQLETLVASRHCIPIRVENPRDFRPLDERPRIAATLNLSLAPVREALSVLAGRGVLDLLPDRGAVMRPLTPTDVVHLWEVLAPVAAKGLELAAQVVATGSADTHQVVQAYEAIGHEPSAVPPLKFILRPYCPKIRSL